MSKEWVPEDVFDVLGDELARQILVVASRRRVTAEELAERCGASQPTVYRRINGLERLDLLSAGTRVRPDGNHCKEYGTTVEAVGVRIDEDGLRVDVHPRRDLADRFGAFWEELEESSTALPGADPVETGREEAHRG